MSRAKWLAATCGLAVLGATAHAQEEAGGPLAAGLEEVVVTAEKKAESLQRTPISIVALGTADLDNMRVSDITDIGNAIPNVQQQAHPSGASSPLITIRGIGAMDNQITQDPSVGIYVDGVYVARSQGMGIQIADLERVEILRGPQGTLYGRNATGGAVNFVTHQPELGAWGVDATLGAGNRDEVSGRIAFNVPVGERFAARFAYLRLEKDGPVRNLGTGEPSFGARDREAIRADLRWQPVEALDLRYVFEDSTLADTAFYIEYVPDRNVRVRPSVSSPMVRDLRPNDVTTRGHSLTAEWDLSDELTLRSISAWRELDSFTYQSYLPGRFGPGSALVGTGKLEHSQWSQELQLLGTAFAGSFDYILGAYYFDEEATNLSEATMTAAGVVSYADSSIANQAYALYAQGTYTPKALGQRLHLTAAGRWSDDERDAALANTTVLIANGMVIPGGSGAGHREYSDFSPSFTLAYDASPGVNLYAKYSEGYKSGGFNTRSSTFAVFAQGFRPEYVSAYELGAKTEFWDRRVRLNAAAFRSDYDDIQMTIVNAANPTTSDTMNAGKAVIQGLELDLTVRVVPGLTASFGGALLDPQYKRIIDNGGNDVTDEYRFTVPKRTMSAQLTYGVALPRIGELTANLNYSQQSGTLNATRSSGIYEFPGYGILNGRLELRDIPLAREGDFSVALWGKNLGDTEYWFINGSLFGGYRAWGESRSYGVDLRYQF